MEDLRSPESAPVKPQAPADGEDFSAVRRVPRLQTVIVLTYLPMAVFAIAQLLGIPFLVSQLDGEAARLLAAARTVEEAALIRALADHAEEAWYWAAAIGMTFAVLGALATVWARRHLERRIGKIVEFAETTMNGGAIGTLPARAEDVLGRLAQDIGRIAQAIARRDAKLRTEAAKQQFDAQLQRAFAMVDTEDEALQIAARAMEHLVPNQGAELLLADADQLELRSAAASTLAPAPRCSVQTASACAAVRRGQTLIFPSSGTIDACPRLVDRERPLEAAVCAPVTIMGNTCGVLHVAMARETPVEAAVIEEFESLINHFGTRMGVMRVLARTRVQAERDPLTGLHNRRSLENQAKAVFRRDGFHIVVIADLDKFKTLNDNHGHEAGDSALKLFARVLTQALRPSDVVARFGGEEFVAILSACHQRDAFAALDRVRTALARASSRYKGPPFTCSFGVAEFPTHGQHLEELLAVADEGLYKAKENGRDQIAAVATSGAPVDTDGGPGDDETGPERDEATTPPRDNPPARRPKTQPAGHRGSAAR